MKVVLRFTDGSQNRLAEFEVLPRVGDLICIEEKNYKVLVVTHYLVNSPSSDNPQSNLLSTAAIALNLEMIG